MKIEIWNEEQKEVERPLRLRLLPNPHICGGVQLCVVDEKGNKISRGVLLSIDTNGRLALHGSISDDFNLKLDAVGFLKVKR